MSGYPELDAAVKRYHAASTVIDREQARVTMDIYADRKKALGLVASAAKFDAWLRARILELAAELSREVPDVEHP